MKFARILFILGMIAVPFSGVGGLRAMGELRTELSAYLFLLTILVMAAAALPYIDRQGSRRFVLPQAYVLNSICLMVMGVLAISFVANFYHISTDYFRDRYGFGKFVTSNMVLLYGLGLAYVTYFLSGDRWRSLILKPMAISVLICVVVGAIEYASKHGALTGFYDSLSKIIHTGFGSYTIWNGSIKWELGWDERLRAVAFEPPALANFCGYAWPWMLAGFLSSRGSSKQFFGLTFALLTILIFFAGARTGFVMLAGNILVFCLLRFVYLPQVPGEKYRRFGHIVTFLLGVAALLGVVLIIIGLGPLTYNVVAIDNVSNISRLASQIAAFDMFFDHPLFGVGFGQYGFHVNQYLPYWGYYSWELQPWLIYPEAPWPAVYSVFARLAGELGLLGFVGWLILWVGLGRKIVRDTRLYQQVTGQLPPMAYPLVMSCYCVLMAGIATDTFRTPMMWLSLGFACRYLYELRPYIITRQAPQIARNAAIGANA